MSTEPVLSRRHFAAACAAAATVGPLLLPARVSAVGADALQSEFLFDLFLERGTARNVGSPGVNRVIVPVSAGAFEGPKLKGTVAGPAGDWIVARPDGSSVLDLRVVLQTDDGQQIYMNSRGIAYANPDGSLFARIVPAFETSAARYTWLNSVVAVGVHRPVPGKVAYRIYRIL